jgi:hypothetical protein
MIEHGASIQYDEKVCTIRINGNYPHKAVIDKVLSDLRTSIISYNYIVNYL